MRSSAFPPQQHSLTDGLPCGSSSAFATGTDHSVLALGRLTRPSDPLGRTLSFKRVRHSGGADGRGTLGSGT